MRHPKTYDIIHDMALYKVICHPILYRVIAKNFVAGVICDSGKIVEAAPILRKFIGQDIASLEKWCAEKRFDIKPVEAK